MMLGLNLENTTSSAFRITATARYLAFGVLTSGSELRIDGTLGSDPAVGGEFYQPIASSAFFIAPYAGVTTSTFNVVDDDQLVAQYDQVFSRAGANLGVNLGGAQRSAGRARSSAGSTPTSRSATRDCRRSPVRNRRRKPSGDYDSQDSPVVPSGGSLARVRLSYIFDAPDVTIDDQRSTPRR